MRPSCLHRENQPDNDSDEPDVGELIIGKLRNGKRNTVYIDFDGAHNDIRETDRRPMKPVKAKKEGDNKFFPD